MNCSKPFLTKHFGLHFSYHSIINLFLKQVYNQKPPCLKSCSRKEISYKTTTSETAPESMEGLTAYSGNDTLTFSNSDITILQFYFSTFDYPTYHLTEEQWFDFFCENTEFTGLKKFIKPICMHVILLVHYPGQKFDHSV